MMPAGTNLPELLNVCDLNCFMCVQNHIKCTLAK